MKQDFWHKHRKLVLEVNRDFRILVTQEIDGIQKRFIIGAGKIDRFLSEEAAIEQFKKVLASDKPKITWWDRKSLKIEFCLK